MRRYETIFILRPDLGESTQKESIRRFENIVRASGGEVIDTDEWGFRELAYNVKGEHRGFYVRLDYGGNGATMSEVERNLKLSDAVLRYLSVLVDRDVEPASVRADLEAQRRHSAEVRAAAEAARAAAEAARNAAAQVPDEEPKSLHDEAQEAEVATVDSSDTASAERPKGEGERNS